MASNGSPGKVSLHEISPTRRQGGELRALLTPNRVGATAGFMGALSVRPGEAVSEHYHPYTGELFELPQVADRAKELVVEQGIADRVHIARGDFFTDPLPERCDAYLLKSILHDWRDGEATAILRSVRKAIGDANSRLIVIDQIVPSSNQWDHAKVIDIDMLVLFGGKERTLPEWSALSPKADSS